MIKVGSLVRVKKEYYEPYMMLVFDLDDLLLVIEESKYYTGFLPKPCEFVDAYECPDVVKDITVYKLLLPKYQIYAWPDYQLEEVQ